MINWFKKKPKKPIDQSRNSEINTSTNQYFIQDHSVTGHSKMFKNISEKKYLEDTFSKGNNEESEIKTNRNERILEDLEKIQEKSTFKIY
jgi:predicted transcriptional regulator